MNPKETENLGSCSERMSSAQLLRGRARVMHAEAVALDHLASGVENLDPQSDHELWKILIHQSRSAL